MTGELGWAGAERTWRASPLLRIVKMAVPAALLAPLELILWLILYVSGVPDAGWVALACALVPWTWLAWRVWIQALVLTRDFVVLDAIVGKSGRIALADVTGVTFWQGVLTIRARGKYYRVRALPLGASYFSGRRRRADDAADAIAAAAGLPALPARRTIIGPAASLALTALIASLLVLGLKMRGTQQGLSSEIGAGLVGGCPALLVWAIGVTIDHARGMLARPSATTGP